MRPRENRGPPSTPMDVHSVANWILMEAHMTMDPFERDII